MKSKLNLLAGVIGCLALTTFAFAADTRYLEIAGRNVFRLRLPLKPEMEQPLPRLVATARLQGMTTILGYPQALIATRQISKPGESAQEINWILKEGESASGFRVIEINPKSGFVKLNYGEGLQVLLLKNALEEMYSGVVR
ncbi:MAG: hypothetical protein HOP33_15120 [Verrucomicrobia bacterium]|nr:hypothetical protein [Verrucomicrobiota bacterium]